MTVATVNITSGPYIGTGAGDEFSYDFRVDDKTQLSVWETTDLGVKTLLTVDTDYTVAGVGVDGGGVITRVAGNLPTDYIWYIRSNYADTQSTAFPSQGGFFPDVHEKALDKRTFVSQQQQDEIKRSIKLDESDETAETVDLTIPALATRASQYLGFDASGNLTTIAGTAGAVTVTTFMETLLDDNDIETALGTLGLSKGTDVASAGTLAVGVGDYFDVTGTTAVLGIGTKFIGAEVTLQFDGILTFTHHATNLILPGGANITTAAGDHAIMREYDTGKWRCVGYFRASSLPVHPDIANTITADMTFAGEIIPTGGTQTSDGTTTKDKMLHIGPWDMSTATGTLSAVVAHGLTVSDIRTVEILIRSDAGELLSHDHEGLANTKNGSSWVGDATDITISRNAGQIFDATTFDLTENTIDNAAAVDKGDGTVGIPITAHDFNAKDVTTIAGTTNYNGTHKIVSQTANEIVITASYVAETFAGTETASWSRGWIFVEYEV
jgi:hypothetical protein